MQNNLSRESHKDEGQNINSNNLINYNQPNCGQSKPPEALQFRSYPATDESDQLQKMLHQIDIQVERVVQKIDSFNLKIQRKQDDYYQMQKLFSDHVKSQIHPASCSNVGDALLKNGKFVVSFIEIITRNEKRDFLKKYLYNYFSQLNNVSTFNEYFEVYKSNLFEKSSQGIKKIQQKNENSEKRKLLLSPQSSQNDVNWSTKVERDTNSPKSGYLDSSNRNNSDKKLKKPSLRVHQQVNQQHEKSEKASKNVKKSNDKRSKVTKLKTNRQSVSKSKNKNKSSAKKTITKSQQKMGTKSIQEIIHSNIKPKQQQNQQSSKLGTFYHYQLNLNRKNQKSLNQVRRSARLSHNKERQSIQSRRNSLRKSSAKKSASKNMTKQKQNDNKKTKKRNQSGESGSQYTTESQDSDEEVLEIDWIKKHLKHINIKDVQLYDDFKALTKNDEKITQLLRQMENSQEATHSNKINLGKTQTSIARNLKKDFEVQKSQAQKKVQIQESSNQKQDIVHELPLQNHQSQKSRNMSDIKRQFKIQQLPLTIDYVVDPDLNNHGIYVLLKLGRVTEIQMGTAYAVSPLTYGSRVNRKHIKQDLQKAKQLAGQYSHNIGYIPMNQQILQLIKRKNQE